ncbi:MAG: peptide-methionine (S)-S-oxide reductase MsrA [Ignavibacteria bacterium]|nr:peptide-methionine (S)-S-oxide reductase MsrA [Ignavibacteria bacterium]
MKLFLILPFLWLILSSCSGSETITIPTKKGKNMITSAQIDTATLGAGCFWCVEAVFQNLDGVEKVISGYAGGNVSNPSYKEVCSGTTGHAEVCQITFNPQKISYEQLLEAFWGTHDPTTLNQQGNDKGTQYRSVVFYHSEAQHKIADDYKNQLIKSKTWNDPIVTEIVPITKFYPAEDYHQNYFNENSEQPYCQFVVRPKVEKFKKMFKEKLKK